MRRHHLGIVRHLRHPLRRDERWSPRSRAGPASVSRSIRRDLDSVGTVAFSFCRPSAREAPPSRRVRHRCGSSGSSIESRSVAAIAVDDAADRQARFEAQDLRGDLRDRFIRCSVRRRDVRRHRDAGDARTDAHGGSGSSSKRRALRRRQCRSVEQREQIGPRSASATARDVDHVRAVRQLRRKRAIEFRIPRVAASAAAAQTSIGTGREGVEARRRRHSVARPSQRCCASAPAANAESPARASAARDRPMHADQPTISMPSGRDDRCVLPYTARAAALRVASNSAVRVAQHRMHDVLGHLLRHARVLEPDQRHACRQVRQRRVHRRRRHRRLKTAFIARGALANSVSSATCRDQA